MHTKHKFSISAENIRPLDSYMPSQVVLVVKNLPVNAEDTRDVGSILGLGRHKRCGFNPWVGKIPWSRKWHPTPVFLPAESDGQRSLVGYSPQGCKKLDMTEAT